MGKLRQIKFEANTILIYKGRKSDIVNQQDHAQDIFHLMQPNFASHAIKLQLDNLILTYGVDAVANYFNEAIKEAV